MPVVGLHRREWNYESSHYHRGAHAVIPGYNLAYPTSTYSQVELQFTLSSGTVPSSFNSGNIFLVQVSELDSSSNQVGAVVNVNGTVINPQAMQVDIHNANTNSPPRRQISIPRSAWESM